MIITDTWREPVDDPGARRTVDLSSLPSAQDFATLLANAGIEPGTIRLTDSDGRIYPRATQSHQDQHRSGRCLMRYAWTARGTALACSAGASERAYDDSGTVDADSAGAVVEWLAARGPVWDGLDQSRAITIEIVPAERADENAERPS